MKSNVKTPGDPIPRGCFLSTVETLVFNDFNDHRDRGKVV